ncbi:MAG: HD-GYP domain-containing protein [Terracidiphilus sp.]|jgi:HD-GYP domain-containing protein (c-di-GMP phosphodiesterase class II)
MTTRLRSRAFLICFVPFAALLAFAFWMTQNLVQSAVREGLRRSLRLNQVAVASIHKKSDLESSRFLKVAGENPALKAGMQLLLQNAGNPAARRTVEDQLRELGEHMGFDFLLVSGPNGKPMAGVLRAQGQLAPIDVSQLQIGSANLLQLRGRTIQLASVPVDLDDANLGSLGVGEFFNFSEFTSPAVLVHDGQTIESNLSGIPAGELDEALAACDGKQECDLRLVGANWMSLRVQSYGSGYDLYILSNVDEATAPIQAMLHSFFLILAPASLLLLFVSSIIASRSIVKPIAAVVDRLRDASLTGMLPEFKGKPSSILEIRALTENYNRAAVSVREAGEQLESAYLEFIGSLANALDARDSHTAGHSSRVSQFSFDLGTALALPSEQLERIRIGALLHDIGKIGVADAVLQKPGALTDAEFAQVKEHPVIGKRILEGVRGFAPFLNAVELHHENWDGSGYPKGLAGDEIPVDARIVHVADAYDAMTSDRAYRKGMSHERAISILLECSGTMFEPRSVNAFASIPRAVITRHSNPATQQDAPGAPAQAAAK